MVIVHVHIQVKPEFVEAFREATIENARNSVREPGVLRFDFLQQADDPARFLLIEIYRDEDAPTRHRETTHYLKWREIAEPMMAEPRQRVQYNGVFLAGL